MIPVLPQGCRGSDYCVDDTECPGQCDPDYCEGTYGERICHEVDPFTNCVSYKYCVWPTYSQKLNANCEVICPSSCPVGEQACPGGYDSNGCPYPDLCLPDYLGEMYS